MERMPDGSYVLRLDEIGKLPRQFDKEAIKGKIVAKSLPHDTMIRVFPPAHLSTSNCKSIRHAHPYQGA
jgi:hypothetical protein